MQRRQTKQRQAILDAIETHGGHLTADEIYAYVREDYPRLSLGTVYRNLRVLMAQGSVRELHFGESFKYFESAKEPHYHLICRRCGMIADAEIEISQQLVALTQRARTAAGFQIEEHRLDFIGVCPKCQKVGRKNRTPSVRKLHSTKS